MKVGLINATKGRLRDAEAAARDFYSVSSQFRYALAYCEQNYDETYIVSIGSLQLIHPDSDVLEVDTKLEHLTKWDKKNWLRTVSNQLRDYFPCGSELYLHTSRWYDLLIPWLEPDFQVTKPLKSMPIGKQLQFYKQHVGQLPSIKNKE